MQIIHLSTPAAEGVFSSVQEAKAFMNALTIFVQRQCRKLDVSGFRFEIVVSAVSTHTGEIRPPHLHMTICGSNYISTLSKLIIQYISSRISSTKSSENGLRVYKKAHPISNFSMLHAYLQKQARYQRAFEIDFKLKSYMMEEHILQIDNPKTGIDYQDDFQKAIRIEQLQILINEEKKRCEFYQMLHPNDEVFEPVLLGSDMLEIISDYESGREKVCIYFPECARYSIENESLDEERDFSPDDDSICAENRMTENISDNQRDKIDLEETSSGSPASADIERQSTENISGNQRDKIDLEETCSGSPAPVDIKEHISGLEETGSGSPFYRESPSICQKDKKRASTDSKRKMRQKVSKKRTDGYDSILQLVKKQVNMLKRKMKIISALTRKRLQNSKIQE